MSWTEHEIEKAISLWNAGVSAPEIGSQVGKTRNAVIGMIGRKACAGDPRVKRHPKSLAAWDDEKMLVLLHMRENEKKQWPAIGAVLNIPQAACATKYHEIIADYERSERE